MGSFIRGPDKRLSTLRTTRFSDRDTSGRVLVAIWILTAIGPLSVDSYLGQIPVIAIDMGTSPGLISGSVSTYLAGLGIGQLILGTFSDYFNRRKLMLISLALFAACSLSLSVSDSVSSFLAIRAVQGFAIGGAIAISRAVISLICPPLQSSRAFGTLTVVMFVSPLLAPSIGAVVANLGSWRLIFTLVHALSVLCFILLFSGFRRLEERLLADVIATTSIRSSRPTIFVLLRRPTFVRHVLISCFATLGFFTYISSSSTVLFETFGVGPSAFTVFFSVNALVIALIGLLFRMLIGHVSVVRLRLVGLLCSALFSACLVVQVLLSSQGLSVALFVIFLSLAICGGGLTIPAAVVLTQASGKDAPGSAAALQGGLAFVFGSLGTLLIGAMRFEMSLCFVLVLSLAYFCAAALAMLPLRPRVNAGRPNLPVVDR